MSFWDCDEVARRIMLEVCRRCRTLTALRATSKGQETAIASGFLRCLKTACKSTRGDEYSAPLRRLCRWHARFLQILAKRGCQEANRGCQEVLSRCLPALRKPAQSRQLEYLDVLEGIAAPGDEKVCESLMELIEASLARKGCVAPVVHKAFKVLADVAKKSDPLVIDFCFRHIDFVYREDIGGETWEEPRHYSALDGLVKVAGRGDATLVSRLLSEVGTDKLSTTPRRNRVIAALGLVSKRGDAKAISILLRLVPGWREKHNERVASAARIALLKVVHDSDQKAMKRCLGDWAEPNIQEFAEDAVRDATKDGEVRGIDYGTDPQVDNWLFPAIGCN